MIGSLIDQCDLVELPPEHAELLLKFVPTKKEVRCLCSTVIAVITVISGFGTQTRLMGHFSFASSAWSCKQKKLFLLAQL